MPAVTTRGIMGGDETTSMNTRRGERVSFSAEDLINAHNREDRVANYQTISSTISSIGDADPTTDELRNNGAADFQESTQTVLISNVMEALGRDDNDDEKPEESGGDGGTGAAVRSGRPVSTTASRLNPRTLRGLAKTSSLPARILTQALDQDMDDDMNTGMGLDGNFYNMFAVNEETTQQTPPEPEFDELDVLTQSSRRAAQARPAHPAECVLPPSEEEHSKAFLFWVKVATNFDGMTLPPKLLMIAYLGWYLAVMSLLPNKSWDPILNACVIGVLVGLVLNANAFAAYKAAFYSCKRAGGRSNLTPNVPTYLKNQTWSVFRLFFIPFAVSSYSGAAGRAEPGTFVSVFPASISVWGPAICNAILLPSLLVMGREWAWKKAEREEQKEFFLRVRHAKTEEIL